MFPILLPNFDPVAIKIGFIAIRWYSLAYIFGILIAIFFIKKQNEKYKIMSDKAFDDLLTYIVLSIILGGRLGYVIGYNLKFFIANPLEIIAIWHGGMSFHGALIGVILGLWLFCRKYKIVYLELLDVAATITPIGLFFGRIANFINMELYGRETHSNFGVIFPNVDNLPRHPSQLYEATLEGIVLFAILFSLSHFTNIRKYRGALGGLFIALYGIFRILIENFRQPDEQLGEIDFGLFSLTMGQILSLPLIIAGIILLIKAFYFKNAKQNQK